MSMTSTLLPMVADGLGNFFGDSLMLACTSLMFRDTSGGAYAGRTLELSIELPYLVSFLPRGRAFTSAIEGHAPLNVQSKYDILAVTVPNGSVNDLKIVEGLNGAGLTFSVLAYAGANGPADNFAKTKAALAAIDLGAWVLSQFDTASAVKTALEQQPVLLTPLAALHGAQTPFHFVVHDRSGASIVIEFSNGKLNIYDNPVGVMTNGPEFSWHITNLNNYTFLTNIDKSVGKFGNLTVSQPDSGIATAGLPASNTSVGRFVRAVYYSNFAQAVTPDKAIVGLGHILNNFDRPKGITIDARNGGGLEFDGIEEENPSEFSTEYTSWTSLTDLGLNQLFIRSYDNINFIKFDLGRLAGMKDVKLVPLAEVAKLNMLDATDVLLNAKAP
ncbi:linear amide C-N hydrolase [Pseudochelatococcus sp. G4_1912]|uniref:linear amide C-N hydrolase n=1 Tax=Pseudochelatococcus sp. G4_1912 TaxID=3114288 RepID=UPI0039C754E0